MAPAPDELWITTDATKFDISFIYGFLSESYWAQGRNVSLVETTIRNSVSFGAFLCESQIGFARVVTDGVVFAYLMDVFIAEPYRRRGYATELIRFILEHEQLRGVEKWLLATRDAHDFYRRFGFRSLDDPTRLMGMTRKPT